jgi:glycogen debranching enzyme
MARRMQHLITLHAAWPATGDQELLEQHLHAAEGCVGWIDKYGDRDVDGIREYQTRSSAGYEKHCLEGFRRFGRVLMARS